MEETGLSLMSEPIYQIIWHHIPQDHDLDITKITFVVISLFDLKIWYVEAHVLHEVVKITGAVIAVLPLTSHI